LAVFAGSPGLSGLDVMLYDAGIVSFGTTATLLAWSTGTVIVDLPRYLQRAAELAGGRRDEKFPR
jgi:hypothetical protein